MLRPNNQQFLLRPVSTAADTLIYIRNLLLDKDIASVTPSSGYCIRRVCKNVDFSRRAVVVEFGPGVGVFTRYLLERLSPDSKLVLIEKNPNFSRALRKRFGDDSRVHIHNAHARMVVELLRESGESHADYIISGIPFSFLPRKEVDHILLRSRSVIRNGGAFLAYQTSRHLLKPLRSHFEQVDTELEVLNIPPMLVYRAAHDNGVEEPAN